MCIKALTDKLNLCKVNFVFDRYAIQIEKFEAANF